MNAYRLPGVQFRRCCFTPTFEKHTGERCFGVQLHLTDREAYRPVETGLYLFHTIREIGGEDFKLLNEGRHLCHLYGARDILSENFDPGLAWAQAEKDSKEFAKQAQEFHLYE